MGTLYKGGWRHYGGDEKILKKKFHQRDTDCGGQPTKSEKANISHGYHSELVCVSLDQSRYKHQHRATPILFM